MITKAQINNLKAREGDAHRAYVEAKKRRESAEVEMHHQSMGISEGDLVEVKRRNATKVYSVTRFDAHGWLYGNELRKDGTPSIRETNLYSDYDGAKITKKGEMIGLFWSILTAGRRPA